MTERPILFSGPMVRAILDGAKTQTRRPVNGSARGRIDVAKCGTPVYVTGAPDDSGDPIPCPFGAPGDRLWVRETWAAWSHWRADFPVQHELTCAPCDMPEFHGATRDHVSYKATDNATPNKWRPSIHMPRWASRIDLEIVTVRVERLQSISDEDARAEGVTDAAAFRDLWIATYGADSWAANPWVWAVEFTRVMP